MKERTLFQNQAQMGARAELTPQANPYKLVVRMDPKSEVPNKSIGRVNQNGPELEPQTAQGAPQPNEAVMPRQQERVDLGDMTGMDPFVREALENLAKTIKPEDIEFPNKENPQPQDRRQMLERIWKDFYGRPLSELTPDERVSVDAAVEVGALPEIRGAQDGPIETHGVQDSEIIAIIKRYNQRLENQAIADPFEELNSTAVEISKRVRTANLSPDEMQRAQSILDEMDAKMAKQISEMTEQQRSRAKGNVERNDPGRYFDQTELKIMAYKGKDQDPTQYFEAEELRDLDYDPQNKEIFLKRVEKERDKIFNSIFKRSDVSPSREFNDVFNAFTDLPFYTAFIDQLQRNGLYEVANRYILEQEMRAVTHDANYAVLQGVGTENLHNFVQRFRDEHADLAFTKPGVSQAMHAYEQAFLKAKEENGGFLLPEDALGNARTGSPGKIHELARKYLKQANDMGLIINRKPGGQKDPESFKLEDWEIDRALAVARGMGIVMGRTIEIAATSIVPKDTPIISLYAQDVIKDISPFRHFIGKFDPAGRMKGNRVFGFYLDRNKLKPWQYKELKELNHDVMLNAVNGVAEPGKDPKDRLLSQLNPLGVGSIFSISTWRISDDMEGGALGLMNKEGDIEWAGTGVLMEKTRRDLHKPEKKKEAERSLKAQLDKMEAIQPLKLLFNLKGVQRDVFNKLASTYDGLLSPEERIELNKAISKVETDKPVDQKEREDEERRKIKYYGEWGKDIDALVMLQEKAIVDRDKSVDKDGKYILDFAAIKEKPIPEGATDEERKKLKEENEEIKSRRDRVKILAETIRETFHSGKTYGSKTHREALVDDFKNKSYRIPFVFGTEDVPYEEYDFTKLGPTAIARRWRDIKTSLTASQGMTELFNKMPQYKKPEDVVETLHKVYAAIDQYDPHTAAKLTGLLAEGVSKFYSKDYFSRLPGGMGTVIGLKGSNSFAESLWGRGATSWDEQDVHKFSQMLRSLGVLTLEEQRELQSKTIGGRSDVAKAIFRNYAQLGLLAVLFYIMRSAVRETK